MLGAKVETRFFEAQKPKLLKAYPGHFAVVCGRRLLGVYPTLDTAVAAVAEGFDHYNIPVGTPILISQIADEVSLRVVAQKGAGRAAPAIGAVL